MTPSGHTYTAQQEEDLRNRIKEYVLKNGISKKRFADMAGVDQSWLCAFLNRRIHIGSQNYNVLNDALSSKHDILRIDFSDPEKGIDTVINLIADRKKELEKEIIKTEAKLSKLKAEYAKYENFTIGEAKDA